MSHKFSMPLARFEKLEGHVYGGPLFSLTNRNTLIECRVHKSLNVPVIFLFYAGREHYSVFFHEGAVEEFKKPYTPRD